MSTTTEFDRRRLNAIPVSIGDTQHYGDDPLAVRETDKYREEYVHEFVEKWDRLIDWESRDKYFAKLTSVSAQRVGATYVEIQHVVKCFF